VSAERLESEFLSVISGYPGRSGSVARSLARA
jgi:hypothetical protein